MTQLYMEWRTSLMSRTMLQCLRRLMTSVATSTVEHAHRRARTRQHHAEWNSMRYSPLCSETRRQEREIYASKQTRPQTVREGQPVRVSYETIHALGTDCTKSTSGHLYMLGSNAYLYSCEGQADLPTATKLCRDELSRYCRKIMILNEK